MKNLKSELELNILNHVQEIKQYFDKQNKYNTECKQYMNSFNNMFIENNLEDIIKGFIKYFIQNKISINDIINVCPDEKDYINQE